MTLKIHPNATENSKFYLLKADLEAKLHSKFPQFLWHKAQFLDLNTPMKICCKSHGFFYATPKQLLSSKFTSCPKCLQYRKNYPYTYKMLTYTPSTFFEKAKEANPQFIYTKSKFLGFHQRIVVRCPQHGQFFTKPHLLLSKTICKACAGSLRLSKPEQYYQKVSFIHNNRYDYSEANYKGVVQNLYPICKHHGKFTINAREHLTRGAGCPSCTNGLNSKAPAFFYYYCANDKYIAIITNRKFTLPYSGYLVAFQEFDKAYKIRDILLKDINFSIDDSSLKLAVPHLIFDFDILNLDS